MDKTPLTDAAELSWGHFLVGQEGKSGYVRVEAARSLELALQKCERSAGILLDELVRLNALVDPALKISTDADKQVLTIEGMRYSYELFKAWAGSMPVGDHFMLAERKDGVIELTRIYDNQPAFLSETELKHVVTVNAQPDAGGLIGVQVSVGKRTIELALIPVKERPAAYVTLPKTITVGLTDAYPPV